MQELQEEDSCEVLHGCANSLVPRCSRRKGGRSTCLHLHQRHSTPVCSWFLPSRCRPASGTALQSASPLAPGRAPSDYHHYTVCPVPQKTHQSRDPPWLVLYCHSILCTKKETPCSYVVTITNGKEGTLCMKYYEPSSVGLHLVAFFGNPNVI